MHPWADFQDNWIFQNQSGFFFLKKTKQTFDTFIILLAVFTEIQQLHKVKGFSGQKKNTFNKYLFFWHQFNWAETLPLNHEGESVLSSHFCNIYFFKKPKNKGGGDSWAGPGFQTAWGEWRDCSCRETTPAKRCKYQRETWAKTMWEPEIWHLHTAEARYLKQNDWKWLSACSLTPAHLTPPLSSGFRADQGWRGAAGPRTEVELTCLLTGSCFRFLRITDRSFSQLGCAFLWMQQTCKVSPNTGNTFGC